MQKINQLYMGKAKTMYSTDNPDVLICEFRNDTSAFNGEKVEKLNRKGMVNNYFNAFIMNKLSEGGVPTHFVSRLNETDAIVKKLQMIPLECVVRNIASGGLSKRLGIESGTLLKPAIFEFFLKDDPLGDPMVNESHIETFKWATPEQVVQMKALTFKVNSILAPLFLAAGMTLVDYKLEFGLDASGTLLLGDEFSPDGCRIWDTETKEILDKDRFRKNLGQVVEGYEIAAKRLGIALD